VQLLIREADGVGMKVSLFVVATTVALTACSPAHMQEPGKFASASRVVCYDVVPVGSHLKERVCTTTAALNQDSKEAQAVLEAAQQRLRDELMMERAMRNRTPRGP
jgi:hypothetical protein